jgi:hypothetical protein
MMKREGWGIRLKGRETSNPSPSNFDRKSATIESGRANSGLREDAAVPCQQPKVFGAALGPEKMASHSRRPGNRQQSTQIAVDLSDVSCF